MPDSIPAPERDPLIAALYERWALQPDNPKMARYVGQFFERQRIDDTLVARVEGHYGTYTVVVRLVDHTLSASCTCYVGQHGTCHHCDALVKTFLDDPDSFTRITPKSFDEVESLADLPDFLNYVSLAELMDRLKEAGITQKAFAEAIGSTSNTITGLKASEARHVQRYELGAVKLAALWVLETFGR